jgi:uncharacterized protein YjbI with pentapeptide repeats/beta-lactamase regulating signal transducer with metallopeptidase domain
MPGSELLAAVSRVGLAVIFNCLWQGALIASVAWVTLRFFTRANATTRYAVWTLTLVTMLVVPIVTTLSRVSVEHPSTITAAQPLPATHVAAARETRWHSTRTHAATPPSAGSYVPAFHVNLPFFVAGIAFGAWLLGMLFILARLAYGLMQLERLKHDSLPLDVAYRDAMPRWTAALKGERDVRICVSENVEVPVAVGLFDSMILLPAHLVHSLDPAEIDQISLHELGHLLRGDDWTNALQRVAGALMFFSPAAWFVSRQMDVEREVACDDYVLESTGAVRPYAFCLTKMAEMTAWPHTPVPAPGVFVTRKNISIRIERLLRTGRAIGSSIAPSIAGVVTVALVAVFLLLRTMTPSIAFTAPLAPAPPAPVILASSPEPARTVKAEAPPRKPVIPVAHEIEAAKPVVVAEAPTQAALVPPPIHPTIVHTPNADPHQIDTHHMIASNGSCEGCNFANANLSGRDFSNHNMEGANFADANLQNARFEHADLEGANFADADLRGVSFAGANLEGCNLRGARLDGVRFDGAQLEGCSVDASRLSPDQVRVFLNKCEGCNFAHANLRGMDLRGIHLEGTNLAGADLRGANLSHVSFEGVNLSEAQLSGANVEGASFEGCNFRGVDLRNVDLTHASIEGSDMGSAIWK